MRYKHRTLLLLIFIVFGAGQAQADLRQMILEATPTLVIFGSQSADKAPKEAQALLQSLGTNFGGTWQVRWDLRANRPHLIQGSGIPLVPGSGNKLTYESLGLDPAKPLTLGDVETQARKLVAANPWLFQLPAGDEWKVIPEQSADVDGKNFWLLAFRQVHTGVPVSGTRLYFRISHGNAVQFGVARVADVKLAAQPAITGDDALDLALAALGATRDRIETVQGPELAFFPGLPSSELVGQRYSGTPGGGYEHRLVWEWRISLQDNPAAFRVRVDALTAEVLQTEDLRMDGDPHPPDVGQVIGGIFRNTHTDPQVSVALPYMRVDGVLTTPPPDDTALSPPPPLTSTFATMFGNYFFYPLFGSCRPLSDRCDAPTAQLTGRYFQITDNCGAIRQGTNPFVTTDGTEVIDFGRNVGLNCATPGFGGAGNTAAARNVYYHITAINRATAEMEDFPFLQTLRWLNPTQPQRVNVHPADGICNAYWNPNTASWVFNRSDESTCADSGQISDVIFHEWGHGLDANTGSASPDQGTGEAFADTIAFLRNGDGCIGEGFRTTGSCLRCRSTCRSGVRDIEAFTIGTTGIAQPSSITRQGTADPTNPIPAWNFGPRCDSYHDFSGATCPYRVRDPRTGAIGPYQGPMGYEGHCESYIASTATWDLRRTLSDEHGPEAGSEMFRVLWYRSLEQMDAAYEVADGGQCNASATVDGCGEGNWYSIFLAMDDADGDLSNGTPNGCRIWSAFAAHGIACESRPACHP